MAEDPFVVIIGTGVAAVTFVRGEAVRGVSGQAGEFGHIVVRPGGPLCRCGQHGCLEAVASAEAIVRAYEERTGSQVDGAHVVRERLATDPVAAEVWAEAMSGAGRRPGHRVCPARPRSHPARRRAERGRRGARPVRSRR